MVSAPKSVSIDTAEFIRTRDALLSAYLGVSMSMDRMVKAYLEHTQTVLDGDATLDIGRLLAPLNAINLPDSAAAQLALLNAEEKDLAIADGGEGGKKGKKRKYARDPNAPKRPLTAYFRYLQQERQNISDEVHAHPERFAVGGKQGDLTKIATERWNAMSADEQQPFRDAYHTALRVYEADLAAYKATLPGSEAKSEGAAVGPAVLPVVSAAADSSESEDSDDSSDDDEIIPAMLPPQPAPVPVSTKKSPKKAAVAASTPARQMFSSIKAPTPSVPPTAATPAAATPAIKRKADAAAPDGTVQKKKRGRKSKAEIAAAAAAAAAASESAPEPVAAPTPAPAPAAVAAPTPAAAAEDGAAKKKKEKKEKKKQKDAAA